MTHSLLESVVLRFGPFELDPDGGELRREGRAVKLRPQAFHLLALLLTRSGALVSREEIRAKLWSGDTFVDFEQGQNHCIRQIRAALGDDARNPSYIQTVPRRGYRFLMPTQVIDLGSRFDAPADAALRPSPSPPVGQEPVAVERAAAAPAYVRVAQPSPTRRQVRRAVGLAVAFLVVIGMLAHDRNAPASRRTRLAVMPFADVSGAGGAASGLTYKITTLLVHGHEDSLDLVSGVTTRAYATSGKTAAEIALELGTDYLLEGSLERSDDRVHVTVQLTDARRQSPVWAHSYVRNTTQMLTLQDDLAQAISRDVAARLSEL